MGHSILFEESKKGILAHRTKVNWPGTQPDGLLKRRQDRSESVADSELTTKTRREDRVLPSAVKAGSD